MKKNQMLLPALLLSAVMITSSSCQKEEEMIPAMHSTTLYQEDYPSPIIDDLEELTEEEENVIPTFEQAPSQVLEVLNCYIPLAEQETDAILVQ